MTRDMDALSKLPSCHNETQDTKVTWSYTQNWSQETADSSLISGIDSGNVPSRSMMKPPG